MPVYRRIGVKLNHMGDVARHLLVPVAETLQDIGK